MESCLQAVFGCGRPRRRELCAAGAARAFTLVELLASIGIMIFVLSITVIAFGPALRSAGTKDSARRIRVALDTTRIRAIQQRRHVRFEAQRAKQNPEEWAITPNAGDRSYEWYQLPEFVAFRTNAGTTGLATAITRLSISFGPDGTVKSVSIDGGTPILESALSPFVIRTQTTRDAPPEERRSLCQFIEITPITGVVTTYSDADIENDSEKQSLRLPLTE